MPFQKINEDLKALREIIDAALHFKDRWKHFSTIKKCCCVLLLSILVLISAYIFCSWPIFVRVPNVSYHTLEDAEQTLSDCYLQSSVEGDSSPDLKVLQQNPKYGEIVIKWSDVELILATPTPEPTFIPSPVPTPEPTFTPSPVPTPEPAFTPLPIPTPEPTFTPSPVPTPEPTFIPSSVPTPAPKYIIPYKSATQFQNRTQGMYCKPEQLRMLFDDDCSTNYNWIVYKDIYLDNTPEFTFYFNNETIKGIEVRNGNLDSVEAYYQYARLKTILVKIMSGNASYTEIISFPDHYTLDYQQFLFSCSYPEVSKIEIYYQSDYKGNEETNWCFISDLRFLQ